MKFHLAVAALTVPTKKFCVSKVSVNYPSLSVINPISNTASPESIPEMINEWFEEESVTRCGQKVTSNVPENFYFTDENSTTK